MLPLKLPRCTLLCAFFEHKELADCTKLRPAVFHSPLKIERSVLAEGSRPPVPRRPAEPSRPGALPPAATPAPGRKAARDGCRRGHSGWPRGFPRSWGQKVPETFLALSLGLGRAARASAGCPPCCPRQDPREAQSH